MVSILESELASLMYSMRVKIQFRDLILAGIPRSGNMLEYFISLKHMSDADKADFEKRIQAGELTDDEKEQLKETSWCCFEKTSDGELCIWHGNVKAMLREIFTTIGLTQRRPKIGKKADESGGKEDGTAGGRQTLQHAVHVDPLRPLFKCDGKTLREAHGFLDRVKHIKDQSGQRSALGRHDYIKGAVVEFILKWPRKGVYSEEDLRTALALCQEDGLGACRSQGHGKFDVIECEMLD